MILPSIHLNGTSGAQLLAQNIAALRAAEHALSLLGDAAPNARDYYTQGSSAYTTAIEDHLHRCEALAGVIFDIGKIIKSIRDQIDQRAK